MLALNLNEVANEAKQSKAARHLLMTETNAALMWMAAKRVPFISLFAEPNDVVNEYFVVRFDRDLQLFDKSRGQSWRTYVAFRFGHFISDFFRRKSSNRDCQFTSRGGGTTVESLNTSHPVRDAHGKTVTVADTIADNRRAANQSEESFDHLTRCCSKSEREILRMYYYENRTMAEIGEVVGVTESRVSQVHARIVKQIRAQHA